jgi:hypothetical protein
LFVAKHRLAAMSGGIQQKGRLKKRGPGGCTDKRRAPPRLRRTPGPGQPLCNEAAVGQGVRVTARR